MFHPYSIEENPAAIPTIIKYINNLCSSEITNMINNISKDYCIDIKELHDISKKSHTKIHLAGNIHYPPPQDIRCQARIRGKGYGHSQCKRKSVKNGLCIRHSKQYDCCIEHNCKRGIDGLGACSGHKGLRLGLINKPIPTTNDDGEIVVKWKRELKYKKRKNTKIKKVKFTIRKKSKLNDKPTDTNKVKHFTDTYLANEINTLMRNMDLNDSSVTTSTIIKRLQLLLQTDLSDKTKFLENCIYNTFDKITEEELEEEDEMFKKPVLNDDLNELTWDGKKYYLHKESNEIFTKNKKLVGHWLNTDEPTFY